MTTARVGAAIGDGDRTLSPLDHVREACVAGAISALWWLALLALLEALAALRGEPAPCEAPCSVREPAAVWSLLPRARCAPSESPPGGASAQRRAGGARELETSRALETTARADRRAGRSA